MILYKLTFCILGRISTLGKIAYILATALEMMDRTVEMTPAYLVTTLMMHLGSRPASLAYLT